LVQFNTINIITFYKNVTVPPINSRYKFPFDPNCVSISFREQATSQKENIIFDGQLAYAYAKRGQVILMEEMSKMYNDIKFVSCHPGWVDTPGVESAYGNIN